jgi:hypothetical protein
VALLGRGYGELEWLGWQWNRLESPQFLSSLRARPRSSLRRYRQWAGGVWQSDVLIAAAPINTYNNIFGSEQEFVEPVEMRAF